MNHLAYRNTLKESFSFELLRWRKGIISWVTVSPAALMQYLLDVTYLRFSTRMGHRLCVMDKRFNVPRWGRDGHGVGIFRPKLMKTFVHLTNGKDGQITQISRLIMIMKHL